MEQKENDMLLNVMANPSFNVQDFQSVGLNVTNTSFQSKDTYENSSQIQDNDLFKDSNNNFSQPNFNKIYNTSAFAYNQLAQDQLVKEAENEFQMKYSKYDLFAPHEAVDYSPEFSINTHQFNPDRVTEGMIRPGQTGPRTKTAAEIAQSQKVWDPASKSWKDSPEASFFGNLTDVRALAQYDNDIDINGIERGQAGFDEKKIEHHKGELKINPDTGTYYYENLNGRSINGRQILHLSDVLTAEDNPLNSVDFLDSDDIQKSAAGSFVKNAALVGAMFIPGVGQYITGATILQQALDIGSTLGKIALGSDNKLCNFVQGMSEATNPMLTRSEHSQQEAWTWENMFGMVGDTVAQLKQQRMLFEQLPRIFGMDKRVLSQKGQQAMANETEKALNAQNIAKIEAKTGMTMQQLTKENPINAMNSIKQLELVNQMKAAKQVEDYVSKYYNTGAVLSKAYMTLLTVNDTYDEAKQAGASDAQAALLTMGYAAAEYGLLSTGLGEWVLPELRANKMKMKSIKNALTKDAIKQFNIESANATTKQAKSTLWAKTINLGKKIFKADYKVGRQGTFSQTLKSTAASALGEGFEETSEEVLSDFVRATYNLYQEANGSSSRMSHDGWQTRYLMSFMGGAIGGGIGNVTLNFNTAKSTGDMTFQKASQELVYMLRNPKELQSFRKMINNDTLGNKYLSATKTVTDENGNIIGYEQGTKDDNQDKYIKDLINKQVDLLQTTLEADGATLDDQSLFDANTLKDLRWQYLYHTTTAGKMIQDYNTLATQALQLHNEIYQLKDSMNVPDQKYKQDDPKVKTTLDLIDKKQKQLDEVKQKIDDINTGKRAALFMAPALLESTPLILQPFLKSATFRGYAEAKENTKFEDIPKEKLETLKGSYIEYLKSDKKNDIDQATKNYLAYTKAFANKLNEIQNTYAQLAQDDDIKKILNNSLQVNRTLNEEAQVDQNQFLTDAEGAQEASNLLFDYTALKLQILQDAVENQDADATVLPEDAQLSALIDPETNMPVSYGKRIMRVGNRETENVSISPELYEKLAREVLDDFDNKVIEEGKKAQNRGFIPSQLRGTYQMFFKTAQAQRKKWWQNVGRTIDNFDDGLSLNIGNLSDNARREGLKTPFVQYEQALSDNSLPNTPITSLLDAFDLSVSSEPVYFSQLLKDLQKSEVSTDGDPSKFSINDSTKKRLIQASILLNQLEAIAEGARSDNADLKVFDDKSGTPRDNIFGINKTLNDVAHSSKDESWEELPTISGEVADNLLLDIRSLKEQIEYYKTLYGINVGQVLNRQTNVGINTTQLLYKKLKSIIDVVPDDWDTDDLKKALDNCPTIDSITDNSGFSNDITTKIKQEFISLSDAVYDFFQKNSTKDLSAFFNPQKLSLLSQDQTILTETSDSYDNNAFFGWLTASAAIKTSEFMKDILPIYNQAGIVPIDSQMQALQLCVANVINGETLSKFNIAAQKATFDYLKSLPYKDRVDYINSLVNNETIANTIATNLSLLYSINFNTFINTTAVFGNAGCGKSAAVKYILAQYLQKFNEVSNVWIINTSEQNAERDRKTLGLENKGKGNFSRTSLLQKISDWEDFTLNDEGTIADVKTSQGKDRYIYDKDKGIINSFELKETDEIPQVILIDEVSRFTLDELQLIDRYAQKNGIAVVTLGDLDQTQSRATLPLENLLEPSQLDEIKQNAADNGYPIDDLKNYTFTSVLEPNQMMHTAKIGTSLRSLNVQQTTNQNAIIARLHSTSHINDSLVLHYYEDDNRILGTKIIEDQEIDQILEGIDKFLANLEKGEKIGYIYYDTNSALYQKLSGTPKYKDHINFYEGNSAQGEEGNYWIIDANPNVGSVPYLQDVYTAVTRAQKGSILLNNAKKTNVLPLSQVKDQETSEFNISTDSKQRYAQNYMNILVNSLQKFTPGVIKYQSRQSIPTGSPISGSTSNNNQNNTSGNTSNNSNSTVVPPTSTTQSIADLQNEINTFLQNANTLTFNQLYDKEQEYKDRADSALDNTEKLMLSNANTKIIKVISAKYSQNIDLNIDTSDWKWKQTNNDIECVGITSLTADDLGQLDYVTNQSGNMQNYVRIDNQGNVTIGLSTGETVNTTIQKIRDANLRNYLQSTLNSFSLQNQEQQLRDTLDRLKRKALSGFDESDSVLKTLNAELSNKSNNLPNFNGAKDIITQYRDDIKSIRDSYAESLLNNSLDFQNCSYEIESDDNKSTITFRDGSFLDPFFDAAKKVGINITAGKNTYSITKTPKQVVIESGDKRIIYKTKPVCNVLDSWIDDVIAEQQINLQEIQNSPQVIQDENKKQQKQLEDIQRKQAQEELKGVQNNGESHTSQLVDSSRCFMTGFVPERDTSGNITGYHKPLNSSHRIDGFNGFLRLNVILDQHTYTPQQLLHAFKLMGKLRGILLNYTDKNSIITAIKQSGIGKQGNVDVSFALKSGEVFKPNEQEKVDKAGDYTRFDRQTDEISEFSENPGYRSRREFVAIISINGKDSLEIPLFQLNNPLSKIDSLIDPQSNDNPPALLKAQGDLQQLFTSNQSVEKNRTALFNIANSLKQAGFVDLAQLCNVYAYTTNVRGITYVDNTDWVPGKMRNLGPQINIDRGAFTSANREIVQDSVFYPISKLRRADVQMSSHVFCLVSNVFNYKGTSIQQEFRPKKGHLFILYSSDPEFDTDEKLMQQYKKQLFDRQDNKNSEQKVQIKYISTPTISVQEYVQSVHDVYTRKSKEKFLGNISTPYRILNAIFNNGKETDIYNLLGLDNSNQIDVSKFNALKNILTNCDGKANVLTSKAGRDQNNNLGGLFDANPDRTWSQQFAYLIHKIATKTVMSTTESLVVDNIKCNTIQSLMGNELIYYQAKLNQSSDDIEGVATANITNDYKIQDKRISNKECTSSGRIGSNMFITDTVFNNLMNKVSDNMYINSNGFWTSHENSRYNYDKSSTPQPQPSFTDKANIITNQSWFDDTGLKPSSPNQEFTLEQEKTIYRTALSHKQFLVKKNGTYYLADIGSLSNEYLTILNTTFDSLQLNNNTPHDVITKSDGSIDYKIEINTSNNKIRVTMSKVDNTPKNTTNIEIDGNTIVNQNSQYLTMFGKWFKKENVSFNSFEDLLKDTDTLKKLASYVNRPSGRAAIRRNIPNSLDQNVAEAILNYIASKDDSKPNSNNKVDNDSSCATAIRVQPVRKTKKQNGISSIKN